MWHQLEDAGNRKCAGRCPCLVQASLGVFWWPPWFSSWTHGLPCPISWPLAIPWRRQRDSAKNSGTFSTIIWLCAECFIRNYVSRVQKHSLPNLSTVICKYNSLEFWSKQVIYKFSELVYSETCLYDHLRKIGTTWELRTATLVPRSIHYIEIDLRNKTISEFRTVFDSDGLGCP